MNDKKFPLGLPEGSVRAILALITVAPVIGASIASIFTNVPFPTEMLAVASFVLGFYFGARTEA